MSRNTFFLFSLLLTLFLGFPVLSRASFVDTFDGYEQGYLNGQGYWEQGAYPLTSGSSTVVSVEQSYSGSKSMYLPAGTPYRYSQASTTEDIESIRYQVFVKADDEGASGNVQIDFANISNGGAEIDINLADIDLDIGTFKFTFHNGIKSGIYTLEEWHQVYLDLSNPDWLSYVFDTTEYGTTTYNLSTSTAKSIFRLFDIYNGNSQIHVWIDSISSTGYPPDVTCSQYNTDPSGCNDAGCCYYQASTRPGLIGSDYLTSYCGACPDTETQCGGDIWNCQYCRTQSTCEDAYCFWNNDFCWPANPNCGAGELLVNCVTEQDCQAYGGYWYDTFCWSEPQQSFIITWDDYYTLNGEYATATDWINDLAESTGSFLEKVGGILTGLQDSFNLTEAVAHGQALGSAVPVARGYLLMVDSFFGGFPLTWIIIVTLTILLAIGVFRLVQKIIQIIHIW